MLQLGQLALGRAYTETLGRFLPNLAYEEVGRIRLFLNQLLSVWNGGIMPASPC
jgi:hypothetical protein